MASLLIASAWTAFARKFALDEAALGKALARLEKCKDTDLEGQLEALDGITSEAGKQLTAATKRKAALGDKPFREVKDRLQGMQDEVQFVRKRVQAQRDAAAAAEEEADAQALLTIRLPPLLRQLRQPDTVFPALIAVGGKATAVLVMRKPISPAKRHLLADYLELHGGVRYVPATCLYEEGVLTFVVESPASGMAKRLRAALLAQTGLRMRVRVRGDDGQLEDEGDAADPDAAVTQTPATEGTPPEVVAAAPADPVALPGPVVCRQIVQVLAATRLKVQAEVTRLETAILDAYAGQAGLAEVQRAVRTLDGVARLCDPALEDIFERAAVAQEENERASLQVAARAALAAVRQRMQSSTVLAGLDDNPFTPVRVNATLQASLALVATKLG